MKALLSFLPLLLGQRGRLLRSLALYYLPDPDRLPRAIAP